MQTVQSPEPKVFEEAIVLEKPTHEEWEAMLYEGWDRLTMRFSRRRYQTYYGSNDVGIEAVERVPLRYNLTNLTFSKRHRKLMRQNADLSLVYRPASLDLEKLVIFKLWYFSRFGESTSIGSWWYRETVPFVMQEIAIYKDGELIAFCFFDVNATTQYSVLACFDPAYEHLSLGTYTLLLEIQHGIDNGKKFHHPGYKFKQKSPLDYKTSFPNTEFFDWDSETWQPYSLYNKE